MGVGARWLFGEKDDSWRTEGRVRPQLGEGVPSLSTHGGSNLPPPPPPPPRACMHVRVRSCLGVANLDPSWMNILLR